MLFFREFLSAFYGEFLLWCRGLGTFNLVKGDYYQKRHSEMV